VGKAGTHQVMRGYGLPLIAYHLLGDVPSKDFLWRPFEEFRAIGLSAANPCRVANLLFQEDDSGRLSIDSFQSNPAIGLASSGAVVTTNVLNATEGLLDDNNLDFNFNAADPMNGMIFAGSPSSSTQGLVFDVDTAGRTISYALPAGPTRRWIDREFLSLRAAQATRHPFTTAQLGDFTFAITVIDGAGNSSTIDVGTYGAGLEEPYQRNQIGPFGCPSCDGGVPGWTSEFETVRIRVRDFLHGGTGVDLADVRTLRFEFGTPPQSTVGRITMDEIELSRR
jgi:hypothetical protein